MKPVYSISIPDYSANAKPDYSAVGALIDNAIKTYFNGKIAVRYLSMQDHKGLHVDELIKIINETGIDKYDPNRKLSVAHDLYTNKGVELFAVPAEVNPQLNISTEAIQDFYEGAIQDRGYLLKIDLVVIYNLNQLELIPIRYDDGIGEDAYRFRHPDHKKEAVLGYIKIL